MAERQITPEALAALVNWPRYFGQYLHDETVQIVERSASERPLELVDVQQSLDCAFQRLIERIAQEAHSWREQDDERRNAA